jgi:5'-deoxynucleotidase YfbR-like HD superfamily hydrolase
MKTPIDRALDAQHVKRWSLVATTAESNVASHSFNVAVIAMAIRDRMFNTIDIDRRDVCYHALLHDIDEVFTGDIPTPTKMAMRAQGVEPNALFEGQEVSNPSDKIRAIIKIADLIDNATFISQHGAGVRAAGAASEVEGRLRTALDGASPDLARAGREVLAYIAERRSEHPEERKRLEAEGKRLREFNHFSRTPGTPYVDRKPRHGAGGT